MLLSRNSLRAELPIGYASRLTQAASSFGATSRSEARRYPGGFNRPVIGSDPYYYARQAAKVLRHASKEDSELALLYWNAENAVRKAGNELRSTDGPAIDAAAELLDVSQQIRTELDESDLHFPIEGTKWVGRTRELSAFALRVIDATDSLYPGLPSDNPTNTPEFWQEINSRMTQAIQ